MIFAARMFVVSFLSASSVQVMAQTLVPPTSFESCTAQSSAQIRVGSKIRYSNCSPNQIAEEYGSLFLSFMPPTARDLQTAPANKRNAFKNSIKAFLRLTVPNVRSGVVDITVTSISPNGARSPFHVATLASFSFNETKGLTIQTLSTSNNNQIGPRFRIRDGETFEVSLNVKYSTETRSNITARVIQLGQSISSLGLNYLPSATSAALQPIASLEQDIASAFSVTTPDRDIANLSYTSGGETGVGYIFRLDPTINPDGKIFVGLRRHVSVFPGEHKVNAGMVNFAFSESDPGSVKTFRLIKDQQVDNAIATLMSQTLYSQLKSNNPADFQMSCEALKTALEDSNFNFTAPDRLAARWAFAFTNPNIRNTSIRQTDCAAKFLSTPNLTARGLLVMPVDVVVPARWKAAQDAADASATAAAQAFITAMDKAVEAKSRQLDATQVPALQGTTVVSFPGAGTFSGQAVGTTSKPLGVFTRTDINSVGDSYRGEVIHTTNSVLINGLGEYVFASNKNALDLANLLGHGPIRRYVGQLNNSMFDGFGRIEWVDNAVFEGQFSSDQPYRGVLTLPDGSMRYGTFLNGKLNGSGVEISPSGTKWGQWSNGTLLVLNPSS